MRKTWKFHETGSQKGGNNYEKTLKKPFKNRSRKKVPEPVREEPLFFHQGSTSQQDYLAGNLQKIN